MKYTVTKYRAYLPVSIERLFESPREGIGFDVTALGLPPLFPAEKVWLYAPWPLWLKKEWLQRGHGEGKRGPKGRLP